MGAFYCMQFMPKSRLFLKSQCSSPQEVLLQSGSQSEDSVISSSQGEISAAVSGLQRIQCCLLSRQNLTPPNDSKLVYVLSLACEPREFRASCGLHVNPTLIHLGWFFQCTCLSNDMKGRFQKCVRHHTLLFRGNSFFSPCRLSYV